VSPEDRTKLEQAAGVSFHRDYEAESLVEIVQAWWETLNDPDEISRAKRLKELVRLRDKARKLGTDLKPTALLDWYDDSGVPHRQWPVRVRREVVKMILEIWRRHGGQGNGSYSTTMDVKHVHDGPMIRLLEELCRQAGIPAKSWPSPHTLHDDIMASTDRTAN
jgi:hypothetical protein